MGESSRPSAEEIILYDKDPATRIATITFNRPDHLNAPTIAARRRYADLLQRANIDDDVKVLVIRGVGDDLGSGADVPEVLEATGAPTDGPVLREWELEEGDVTYPPRGTYRRNAMLGTWYANARGGCRSLQEFKKISIVEAKGYCYGWHFYQAGDADLVVSSEDALFGHPSFRYVGVAPRLWTWVEMMGLRKFQEMLFTGRPFTAKEMAECGFVNSVVPRDKLEEETLKYATACSQTRPVDTVAVQKTFLEIYKQYRGEYMGSLLTAMVEGLWPYMRHEPRDLNFGDSMGKTNIASIVKNL